MYEDAWSITFLYFGVLATHDVLNPLLGNWVLVLQVIKLIVHILKFLNFQFSRRGFRPSTISFARIQGLPAGAIFFIGVIFFIGATIWSFLYLPAGAIFFIGATI